MVSEAQNRPQYFDTHAHLNDHRLIDDLPAVLQRMREAGVDQCVVVGSSMESSRSGLKLVREHSGEGMYAAVGVHPHDAKFFKDEDLDEIAEMLKDPLCVAWGEIGLDYYYDHSPRTDQKSVFKRQLSRATVLDVPVILHVRDAHPDALAILKEQKERKALPPFVAHCFSGSWEIAREYLNLGGYISFAGPITFKNAAKLPEVAQKVPLDRILIETDCPYLSPEPMRGKRNEPTNVCYVAAKIAALRSISIEETARATTENALAFYRIKA